MKKIYKFILSIVGKKTKKENPNTDEGLFDEIIKKTNFEVYRSLIGTDKEIHLPKS